MKYLNIIVMAMAVVVFSTGALPQDKAKAVMFNSVYADDEKLCGRLKDILENELKDFKSETIGKHENFVPWTYMRYEANPLNPNDINEPKSLYGKILTSGRDQHPFWVLADINNDGEPEYVVRLFHIVGSVISREEPDRDHRYNREFVTIYSGDYPKLIEGSIHPKATHFMSGGDNAVYPWIDIVNFQSFPRYLSQIRKKKIWVGENSIALNEKGHIKYDKKFHWLLESNGEMQGTTSFYLPSAGSPVSHIFTYQNQNFFVTLAQSFVKFSTEMGIPGTVILTQYEDQKNVRLKCVFHNKSLQIK